MRKAWVAVLPVGFGLVGGWRHAAIKVFLFFDNMSAVILQLLRQQLVLPLDPEGSWHSSSSSPSSIATVPGVSAVPTLSVRFLHGKVEYRGSSVWKVVIAWDE